MRFPMPMTALSRRKGLPRMARPAGGNELQRRGIARLFRAESVPSGVQSMVGRARRVRRTVERDPVRSALRTGGRPGGPSLPSDHPVIP